MDEDRETEEAAAADAMMNELIKQVARQWRPLHE
jgi:hypothetical protein